MFYVYCCYILSLSPFIAYIVLACVLYVFTWAAVRALQHCVPCLLYSFIRNSTGFEVFFKRNLKTDFSRQRLYIFYYMELY